jgi:hypothetical protein
MVICVRRAYDEPMVVNSTVRICLDCGRDNLASPSEEIERCPDCDSVAIY